MASDGQSWQVNVSKKSQQRRQEIQETTTNKMEDTEADLTLLQNIQGDFQSFIQTIFDASKKKEYRSETFTVNKGVNLSEILNRLCYLLLPSENKRLREPDTWNHISILSKSLQCYLQLLEKNQIDCLADKLLNDTTEWISNVFSLDNMHASFHDQEIEGLVKVCKLALHSKYTKYATDGFTALYTRPPVIYISSAAPPEFPKQLQNQLGLPQSSICSVPCNTMFGSPYTMDVAALERLLTDDVSCGKTPLILIAYAGTPLSGHTDNLSKLRELCTQSGVWFHVEGDTLANLALSQIQPSIQVAASADSVILNLSKWFGISSLPCCTFYRCNNPSQALASGLIADSIGKLKVLPIWIMTQFMGTHDLQNIIEHASVLAQQMSNRLDMINGIKRVEQPTGISPVVIFKYKASPNLPLTLDENDEEEKKTLLAAPRGKIDVSQTLMDAFNKQLYTYLDGTPEKVEIDHVDIPREGTCLRFNPLLSSRANGTSKVDVDNFIESLQSKIIQMDNLLINRDSFTETFKRIPDVAIIDTSEQPAMGAFQCIPKYWKTKVMTNLSDMKKHEANDLNREIYVALSSHYKDSVSLVALSSGLNCIQFGTVDESFSLQFLGELVLKLTLELEDNAKFVESLKDSVQQSIEEAQTKLERERDEKFFEDGVLRSVPLVASLYNWWSPPPKEDHGVTGRSFDLSSGKLETTEQIYKLKMQIHDDQSDRLSTLSQKSRDKSNAPDVSSVEEMANIDDTTTTSETAGQVNTAGDSTAQVATDTVKEEVKESDV